MARIYLKPTAFIDAPFGYDGQALRLAGGLCWFSAIELIRREGGRRVSQQLVPVDRIEPLLASLPFDERLAAEAILTHIVAPRAPLAMGERMLRFDQPQIMGILNLTPDSFSDGGRHTDPAETAAAVVDMAAAGAALIDVGGESTRPGAEAIWEGDEIARVLPLFERLRESGVALSIDTRKAAVMAAALGAGAGLVNDVSALLFDTRAIEVVRNAGCPIVLMHHRGTPENMQRAPHYEDALLDVYDWLAERVDAVTAAGVDRAKIIVDPGIGFGKSLRHNLEVLNGLSLFHGLGCPLLLGASRKRTIGALSNEAPVDQRLGGSIALVMMGLAQGIQLFRVHDVSETVQAARVWRGLRDAALTPLV